MLLFSRGLIMKRFTLLFVLFVFALSLSSASAPFVFSGGCNIYGATVKDGVVDISDDGIIMKTTNTIAQAKTSSITLSLDRNTLLSIKEDEERITVYLIDGKVDVKTLDGVSLDIYTPVTKTEVREKRELRIVSTESEEKIYSYSSSPLNAYDALRGEYVTVEAGSSHDYFYGYIPMAKKTETGTTTITEEEIIVPAAPQFLSPNVKLKEVND